MFSVQRSHVEEVAGVPLCFNSKILAHSVELEAPGYEVILSEQDLDPDKGVRSLS